MPTTPTPPENIFLTVNGERVSLAELIANPAAATSVRVDNCPGLTALPELPAATVVRVYNCPGLAALPALPAAAVVRVYNCPGRAALPELPAATDVRVENCPGLAVLNAGADRRGYQFVAVRIRGAYRILAGCRNFSIEEALRHWGRGGPSDRPDCFAMVENLAAQIAALREEAA